MTVAVRAPLACTATFEVFPVEPQTGFWYDPVRSGVGFGIERAGAKMLLSAYMYRDDGTPFWFNATSTYGINTFTGNLEQFVGGPPLGENAGPGSGRLSRRHGDSGLLDGSSYRISEPACISSAIAVGSTTKSEGVSSFSNDWDLPLVMAPGTGIISSVPGGYASKNGTSMATPHVSGAIAVLRALFPTASVADLHDKLFATGIKVGFSYNDFRRINIRDAAVALDQPNRILPDSGWWWTPGANGRGYFIETQGGQVFMASYHYRGDGPADWAVGQGQLAFAGQIHVGLRRFVSGTSLDGAPRVPVETTGMGQITLQFSSRQTGVIQLPDGRRQILSRFAF